MHLSKVFVTGILAVAAAAETESMCGGASTVYVTVTVPQTTRTVQATIVASSTSLELGTSSSSESLVGETSTDIITTSTSFHTITNQLSLLPDAASSAKTEGPYSFAEHSGTTIWLGGKTPPSSESLVVKTTAITVQPVPTGVEVSSAEPSTSTSYSTLSLTTVTSKVFTKTVTESFSSPLASAKPFTGIASYGWNSTLTTLLKVPVGKKGTAHGPPTGFLPSITNNGGPPSGTGHHAPRPYPTGNVSGTLAERQVGATVVITIGGVVVSWTNSYDGSVPTTSSEVVESSASVVNAIVPTYPTTTLAVYPWDLPSITSLPQSSQSAVQVAPTSSQSSSKESTETPTSTIEVVPATTPSTTVAVYPWNLSLPSDSMQVTETSQPTASLVPVAFTGLTSESAKSSSVSTSHSQPGIPSLQPTFVPSLMSHVPQATITAISSSSLIAPFTNTSSASSTAAVPSASCSGAARFTIGFDDLPHFSSSADNPDIPPIFNPYNRLYWEEHFGYVPPPDDPFPPVSPPQLAVYRVDNNTNVDADPDAGDESIGEFGAGPRFSDSAYWIDAYSAYLGCSNAGPGDCTITINGYDAVSSTRAVFTTVTQPPCPGLKNCTLALVEFAPGFRKLSGIQILAAVDSRPVTWYMDDLHLGWSNNTCAAITERNSHQ